MKKSITQFWHSRYVGIIALTVTFALILAACVGQQATSQGDAEANEEAAAAVEPVEVRVASLKGPTSIGLASFIESASTQESAASAGLKNTYTFTMATAADEVLPAIIKGDIDIALIPANAAAVLYNKTEGGISVIDINTLGVLNVVTGDASIAQFSDLAGKTVFMTGKGTTPEYTMNYLLGKAGIADQVTLEFKAEPTEVVQALSADPTAVGVLPQPFATAAGIKNEALKAVIDLNDVWATYSEGASQMVTGVTVVRNEFLAEHADAVAEFVTQHAKSVDAAVADPAGVAPLVVKAGIIDAEPVAAKAIPSCHLVCLTGKDITGALPGYLQTLFDSDPASVGGKMPADDFYWLG